MGGIPKSKVKIKDSALVLDVEKQGKFRWVSESEGGTEFDYDVEGAEKGAKLKEGDEVHLKYSDGEKYLIVERGALKSVGYSPGIRWKVVRVDGVCPVELHWRADDASYCLCWDSEQGVAAVAVVGAHFMLKSGDDECHFHWDVVPHPDLLTIRAGYRTVMESVGPNVFTSVSKYVHRDEIRNRHLHHHKKPNFEVKVEYFVRWYEDDSFFVSFEGYMMRKGIGEIHTEGRIPLAVRMRK